MQDHSALLPPARRLRFDLVCRRLSQLRPERAADILDVGCGDGWLTERMAVRHPACRVRGVDVNRELLARAQRRAEARSVKNVSYLPEDVTVSLDSGPWDVVTAIECLEEIPDDEAAIQHMAAVLRPGGLLIGHAPELAWRPTLRGSLTTWRNEVRHGYSEEELMRMLASAGIEVLEMTPTSHALVRIAQELWERGRPSRPLERAAYAPLTELTVRLERAGARLGAGRAWFVVGRRR